MSPVIKLRGNTDKSTSVSNADYDFFLNWNLYLSSRGYVVGYPKGQRSSGLRRIHRVIFFRMTGKYGVNEIDHKNGDLLNNNRTNLREATRSQQMMNRKKSSYQSSQFKGVHWDSWTGKWRVRIKKDGQLFDLGRFDLEIQAAQVYDEKAKELFGEFAKLNFML